MRIIGINNEMYISSACLIEDGRIVAAAAEERYNRQKRARNFPIKSIDYCLKEGQLDIQDIDYMATSWNPGVYFRKFNPIFSGKRRHLVEQLYSVPDHLMELYGRPNIDYIYQEASGEFGASRIYHITHHMAHAANGFFLSPFESAAILTADAQGEFESTTFCMGNGNEIKKIQNINYPHSIGGLYSTITEYLGFRSNSDEWKVMAMASYANPKNKYYHLMKDKLVSIHDDGLYELNLNYFKGYLHEQPNMFQEKLYELFGPSREHFEEIEDRHFQIAAALQKTTEDILAHLLNHLYQLTKTDNLVLSGGCFMNSVFNGKVLDLTPFNNLFISSCPDDSGNCFGAALYLFNHILKQHRNDGMVHNFYGSEYKNAEIKKILSEYGLSYFYKEDVSAYAAGLLADEKIIGWFQGRMEFGQRALGNRSILASPKMIETKDKLNKAVKFREMFRPFALSILKERSHEYMDMKGCENAFFMEKVLPVRTDKRELIPAVVHIDGSARVQTVDKDTNALFYSLIQQFDHLTGVPIVLNTSFNLNGEPIVCSPTDAVKTFFSCGLDALIIGNYVVCKESPE